MLLSKIRIRRTCQAIRVLRRGQWCTFEKPTHIIVVSSSTKGTRMEIGLSILGTLVVVAILLFGYRYAQCGGDFAKHRQAQQVGQRFLTDAKFKEAVDKALEPPKPPEPPKPSPEPILLLTLMQREGRLLDFLLENVDGADNETLGAGVRTIHQSCQKY